MKKKIIVILLLILSVFHFTGCSFIEGITGDIKDDILAEEASVAIFNKSTEIRMATVVDPSREAFVRLFCEKVQSEENFDRQVDNLFEFLSQYRQAIGDDEKVDYAPLSEKENDSKFEGTKRVYWHVATTQYAYQTVSPNEDEYSTWYRVSYSYTYYVRFSDKEKPEEVGLHYITFKLLNTTKQIAVGTNLYT